MDSELNTKRQQLRIDGARLFDEIDHRNLGFISINNFANWVCENCGFHIADEDLPLLEKALDGVNDYRITREGFMDTVCVPQDPEEDDEPMSPAEA